MEIAPEIIREIEKQRDDAIQQNARLTAANERALATQIAMAEEVAQVKNENDRLSATLQAAANQRYRMAAEHEDAARLIDGLTILADKWQRRAMEAESREVDL